MVEFLEPDSRGGRVDIAPDPPARASILLARASCFANNSGPPDSRRAPATTQHSAASDDGRLPEPQSSRQLPDGVTKQLSLPAKHNQSRRPIAVQGHPNTRLR